jgi:hypothetical protein
MLKMLLSISQLRRSRTGDKIEVIDRFEARLRNESLVSAKRTGGWSTTAMKRS